MYPDITYKNNTSKFHAFKRVPALLTEKCHRTGEKTCWKNYIESFKKRLQLNTTFSIFKSEKVNIKKIKRTIIHMLQVVITYML